jgi:hypothetical protein
LPEKLLTGLVENIDGSIVQNLVVKIAQLILSVRHDASPLASLGTKLVSISRLSFSDLSALDSNLDLNAGLNIPSKQINFLVVAIIGKAAERASEAAVVAGKPELVASLVSLWLRTEDTLLASKAQAVLVSLLEVDQEDYLKHGPTSDTTAVPPGGSGSGLLWRRLFGDKVIYEMFYSNCSLSNAGQPGQLGAREKSIAQGRLMDFIRNVGELDWAAVSESHLAEIESKYRVQEGGGLLEFAASHMVEEADALAYLTLIAFFTDLLIMPLEKRSHSPAVASAALNFSSPALEFLISKKLHQKTLSYYLEPTAHNQLDLRFLSGPSTKYLVTYLSTYPRHLLERSPSLITSILERLQKAFNISTNTWGQQEYPRNSLEVLASIPRVLLIQDNVASNPLLMLPTKPWNAGIFHCLGTLFHGPKSSIAHPAPPSMPSTNPDRPDPTSPTGEAAAARVLYHLFATRRPDFWANIVASADAVSLPETAMAAISLVEAVLTADWAPLPPTDPSPTARYSLPTEEQIQRLGLVPAEQRSLSGVWAILHPPALSPVVAYLFQHPKMFDKGSGVPDDGSSTYSVAVAKYDVLVKFHERLKELKEHEFDDVLETVGRRVRQGPWPRGVVPGERVEAMEM